MSRWVKLDSVGVEIAGRQVLHEVTAAFSPVSRAGVVGPNGVGKTTLLRLVAGDLSPADGVVTWSPGLVVGYVEQVIDADLDETVGDYLCRKSGVAEVVKSLDDLAPFLGGTDVDSEAAYYDALELFNQVEGDTFDSRLHVALVRVGLHGVDPISRVGSLSGGQRSRVMLALLMLQRFDLVLLDEPTNNLDLDGRKLLGSLVNETRAGVVAVTHDRQFLDDCMTQILAIDRDTRSSSLFTGNWSGWLAERDRQYKAEVRRWHGETKKRRQLERQIEQARERAIDSGAKGRSLSSDRDKMGNDWRANRAGRSAGRTLAALESQLDVTVPIEPPAPVELSFRFPSTSSPKRLVTLQDSLVKTGPFSIGPVNLDLLRGDRVAIVGPNGAGKSTLVRMLIGTEALTSGSRFAADGLRLGSIDQDREPADHPETLLAAVVRVAHVSSDRAQRALERLGLSPDRYEDDISVLSPGERTRVQLAAISESDSSLLVMDEPTNHLDIEAAEELEAALAEFSGSFVVVSHDQWFLDEIGHNVLVEVETGRVSVQRQSTKP